MASKNFLDHEALDLIKIALQSNALELFKASSATGHVSSAQKNAEFLLTLYRQLQGIDEPSTGQ
jgi:hypothetical protein